MPFMPILMPGRLYNPFEPFVKSFWLAFTKDVCEFNFIRNA